MGEEWRVTLIFNDSLIPGKRVAAVRDLLRGRLGDDISVSVSGDKERVFLYAGAASAAEEAAHAAQDVLAQQALNANLQIELWDPAREEWRDPQVEPPEDEDEPGRPRSKGSFLDNVLPYLPYIDIK
jgi:hypothetical protein